MDSSLGVDILDTGAMSQLKHLSSRRGLPLASPLRAPLMNVELKILSLLEWGLTNQEIADELTMSIEATKWRLNRLFGKLQVRNRNAARARARQLVPMAPSRHQLPPAGPLPEPLDKIEREILGLLDFGLTNREIAETLAMTVGTIKWRMTQIFGKLQVRNRIEALVRARQINSL
jgi:ATP/maltotriose-dependent transcriptional regulator MalT